MIVRTQEVNQDLDYALHLALLIFLSLFCGPSFLAWLVVSPELRTPFCLSGSLFDFKVGGQNFDGRLPRLDRQLHGIPIPILVAEQFDGTGAIIANPLETCADFVKRNHAQPRQEAGVVGNSLFARIFKIVQVKHIDGIGIEVLDFTE